MGRSPTDESLPEEVLHGGNTSVVVRVGDTVRRQTGHWTPAVHDLLAHLSSVGFSDAPDALCVDGLGREILPFVAGEVGLLDPGRLLPQWFRTAEACMASRLHSAVPSLIEHLRRCAINDARAPGRALRLSSAEVTVAPRGGA